MNKVLIIGITGSGKSTLVNSLLAIDDSTEEYKNNLIRFPVRAPNGNDAKAVTRLVNDYKSKNFTFVDTPGLNDTEFDDVKILSDIVKKLKNTTIQAVILVINKTVRFTKEFLSALGNYKTALNLTEANLIVVRTYFMLSDFDGDFSPRATEQLYEAMNTDIDKFETAFSEVIDNVKLFYHINLKPNSIKESWRTKFLLIALKQNLLSSKSAFKLSVFVKIKKSEVMLTKDRALAEQVKILINAKKQAVEFKKEESKLALIHKIDDLKNKQRDLQLDIDKMSSAEHVVAVKEVKTIRWFFQKVKTYTVEIVVDFPICSVKHTFADSTILIEEHGDYKRIITITMNDDILGSIAVCSLGIFVNAKAIVVHKDALKDLTDQVAKMMQEHASSPIASDEVNEIARLESEYDKLLSDNIMVKDVL